MPVIKGTNSYATVAEADLYFADRLDVTAWTSADSTQKGQALITATAILDDQRWIGTAVSDSQTLSFPRDGEYFDPRVGASVLLEGVPTRILTAVYELAYHLLNNDNIQDDTGLVDSISIGAISLSTIRRPNLIPGIVKRAIRPLLDVGGNYSWWRAN
jgi:hypothetical protein